MTPEPVQESDLGGIGFAAVAGLLLVWEVFGRLDLTMFVPPAVDPEPGKVDGNAGPVVKSNAENWRKLLGAIIALPASTPKPEYRGSRAA